MEPTLYPLLIDRLTPLFGARRVHFALGLVEFQTACFKRQPEIGEKPTHFGLGVRDKPLINYAMDFAWKHAVELGHYPCVIDIIAAQVALAISMLKTSSEIHGEIGEAAGERVPPG